MLKFFLDEFPMRHIFLIRPITYFSVIRTLEKRQLLRNLKLMSSELSVKKIITDKMFGVFNEEVNYWFLFTFNILILVHLICTYLYILQL